MKLLASAFLLPALLSAQQFSPRIPRPTAPGLPRQGTTILLPPTQPVSSATPPAPGGIPSSPGQPAIPACASTTPLTASPFPIAQISAIIPQGNINPSAHVLPTNHLYIGLPGLVPGVFPVFAPADMTLTGIVRKQNLTVGTTNSYTEYSLTFQVCDAIFVNFDHLGNPSAKITNAIAGQMPLSPLACTSGVNGTIQSTACQITVSVPVSAAEQLASSSGITPTFDFGAWNTQGPAQQFLQPRRYLDESNYNVCPVSLFAPAIQSQLTALFGTLQGTKLVPRTVSPLCGTIDSDVASTLSGAWWPTAVPPGVQSVAGDESGAVAFTSDNIDPSVPVISLGNGIPGIQTGRYVPAGGATTFTSIQYTATPTITCFANLSGAQYPDQLLLVSLIAPDQLRIEGQRGSCANPKFTSQALVLYR